MHFALPPRKTSQPPPYLPRASRLPGLRRSRLKVIALAGLFFLTLIYLVSRPSRSRNAVPTPRVPKGNPPVVLVTVLDETKYSKAYLETVKENRMQYAEKHGYQTLLAKVGDYDLAGAPGSWTTVVAMRDALTKFPDCHYVWHLDASGFVMNPKLKIEEHIMKAAKLDELMKKDVPVVPPDSIIKTFSHLKGQDVDLVLTQDKEGLSAGSLIVRNGEWARFFLETWFGPLYRSYNFQKAEAHALEHIVQWHPTILSRMAIIDQRVINAYGKGGKEEEYKDGDLVIRFPECTAAGAQSCETQSQVFVQAWRRVFAST
ncbi:galactosyl transferase GMA12/MNN10 family-domain-containing protein [Parachaetomium inaequale]|uniref:Galactosyl transferase GMA12/MNN10 family-domain-containing protein n=1 Tax=Parachaetomium inaequale TaxID=2588326 RepID=A0AAN6PDT8_9PEZI|nr:galactosyl transferase GMA12/MNN10 family-domain-containing protein [Parachaetomium inaequale]